MACALTQGYIFDCRDSFGGLKEVYVIEKENIETMTETLGVITVMTKATGKRWFKYNLVSHTAEAEDAFAPNRENGTVASKQSLKFPINKMTTAVRNELLLLAQNKLLVMIVDGNEKAWLYGKDYGMVMSKSTAKTGKTLSDRNGYELEFESDEKYMAPEVLSSIVTDAETPGT